MNARTLPDGPLVAWYGDDFTGSAAVMEVLTFAGFPSVLFFDIPTPAQRARFGALRGIGVAGEARARPPEWMAAHLPPIYQALRDTGAPIVHYKVCSTFDSAPEIGSIGAAILLAIDSYPWQPAWVPLVVAAPAIGRWQAFGQLFASAGDVVHRLDRHPTMATHPVTPMHEADVTRHLALQTGRSVGLVDLRALKSAGAEAAANAEAAKHEVIALDVIDDETLEAAGALVWGSARRMFAVGSQGLEYALAAHWRAAGLAPAAPRPPPVRPAARIAAVSGSCSPVTADQIAHAEAHGFAAIAIDPRAALDPDEWARERGRAVERAVAALGEGRDPLVHSARGPDDPAVAAFREATGGRAEAVNARLGEGLGQILAAILCETGIGRAAIAGGDTSSAAARGLGIYAVTAEAALAPGAALLRGHSEDPGRDGIELALKGGQMGPPDFFARLRDGAAAA